MEVQDFRKLKVWQKAHALTLAVYGATRKFPRDELYGLTSQSRRSAASVPANIAEGCGRNAPGDFVRFLEIAAGSASELEYQLLLARDLRFLAGGSYEVLAAAVCEVKQMLASLTSRVRAAR
jgi:four helix bundle protein